MRATLRNTARAYGGIDCLASVMGIPKESLAQVSANTKRRPSGTLAIRLAQAAGISLEALLSGVLTAADRCPMCGHRPGDGRLVVGGAR